MIFFFAFAIQHQLLAPSAGCETVGTELFCPPADAADPYFGAMAESAFRQRVEAARQELRDRQSASSSLRKRVGAMIASGDCDSAYRLALAEGDLDLAAQSKVLCPV